MGTSPVHSTRLLPDGTPLHNRLLAALPAADYARIQKHLHMNTGVTGRTLQAHGAPITEVYFPNGGVFSVTNEMRDGALVEVATVGIEGGSGSAYSLAIGLGRAHVPAGAGWPLPIDDRMPLCQRERNAWTVPRRPGAVRAGQPPADHARRRLQRAARGKQRRCRWLLQTQDRVGSSDFLLKQDFLAIMLGVQRPTVTLVTATHRRPG